DVEAGENVYVLGEKGRITGGIVRAKGNIVTKTLGNPMNMATCIKAGTVSYREKDLLEIKKQQESCLYQLKLLKDQKLKMENDYRPEQRNKMPIFIKIENAIYTKEEEMKYLDKRHSQIMELIKKSRSAVLIVKQEIFEGVEVFLAGQLWHSINAAGIIVSMTGVKINVRPL
ncbi:MAG: DUF342 domain-containing protein, partial [Pseudobutyrivibrio sp.]|nr:DUF342 domain-containing protein [Pseudobutyrivibrio sp.]